MAKRRRQFIEGLTEELIRENAAPNSLDRGIELYRQGFVALNRQEPGRIEAAVRGTASASYNVIIVWRERERVSSDNLSATCTCPDKRPGFCKHCVATLMSTMDVVGGKSLGLASAVVAAQDPMKHQRWLSAAFGIRVDEDEDNTKKIVKAKEAPSVSVTKSRQVGKVDLAEFTRAELEDLLLLQIASSAEFAAQVATALRHKRRKVNDLTKVEEFVQQGDGFFF